VSCSPPAATRIAAVCCGAVPPAVPTAVVANNMCCTQQLQLQLQERPVGVAVAGVLLQDLATADTEPHTAWLVLVSLVETTTTSPQTI
jgi:hypothetical protein